MIRNRRLAWLLAITCAGCGGETDRAVTSSGAATPAAESPSPEPVPFESIPLASDASYDSPRVADGMESGEVREFTRLKIRFCWCPAGTFRLGSDTASQKHLLNEGPVQVTFSKGFWLQQTELTQDQYEQLMGSNPSFYVGGENPVDSVTWPEAVEFGRRLSELPPEKEVGNLYRLPTEAEWEYGCRAGSTTDFSFGDDEESLGRFAWYSKNSERTTHPVGGKEANAWGLHDMHGNVAEWCQDFYGAYSTEAVTDPRGPESGEKRTLRGGGWFFDPMFARSAHRDGAIPTARYVGFGFRLVATNVSASSAEAGEDPGSGR